LPPTRSGGGHTWRRAVRAQLPALVDRLLSAPILLDLQEKNVATAPPWSVDKACHIRPLRVSVIINTLDRANLLARLLLSLEGLRYPELEVIVVEGPSKDHTAEVLAAWEHRIKRRHCSVANLAVSRNVGLCASAGELVAFIDDDAVPEPDWLARLVAPFSDPRVAAVGGPIRGRNGVTFWHRVLVGDRLGRVRQLKRNESEKNLPTGICLSFTGTNICLRRQAALAVGGFDESYRYFLEETDLLRRMHESGFGLIYVASAQVHHSFGESDIRDVNRVPTDLSLVTASLTYFCLKHGIGEGRARIRTRLLEHFREIRWHLLWLIISRQITPLKACRLWRSALQGLLSGFYLARTRELPPSALPTDRGIFRSFGNRVGQPLRLALAVLDPSVLATLEGAEHLAAACVALRSEVAVLVPGCGQASVAFKNGYWLHRLRALRFSAFWPRRRAIRKAWGELCRVNPRRAIQFVIFVETFRGTARLHVVPFRADVSPSLAPRYAALRACALVEQAEPLALAMYAEMIVDNLMNQAKEGLAGRRRAIP
jgi:cellulose synthase/poly-beta-1,6-N-acetylglucosamine synthase-like glycosyltransferase